MKTLKALLKPFGAPQKRIFIFILIQLSEMHGVGTVRFHEKCCPVGKSLLKVIKDTTAASMDVVLLTLCRYLFIGSNTVKTRMNSILK